MILCVVIVMLVLAPAAYCQVDYRGEEPLAESTFAIDDVHGTVHQTTEQGDDAALDQPKGPPWTFWVTASPTVSIPFGDWFEGIESGVGFSALASVGVAQQIGIDFGIQYQPLGVDDQLLRDIEATLIGLGANVTLDEVDFSLLKFFGAVRFLGKAPNSPFWGYGAVGMGGYQHRTGVNATVDGIPISDDVTETKFAFTVYGGGIYKFSNAFGIDVGAQFDSVTGTVEGIGGTSNGYLFEFHGGIAVGF
jgi:opacity protein-like surface antigen